MHGGFDFRVRNDGDTSLLDFSRALILVLANSFFKKREDHLVTFQRTVVKTHIDYLLCKKGDRGLCTDCNVISSECLSTQYRLLIMDLEIKKEKKKRGVFGQPKIKWGGQRTSLGSRGEVVRYGGLEELWERE